MINKAFLGNDFLIRLTEEINNISGLDMQCKIGFLDKSETLSIYPLETSRPTATYMDGSVDIDLILELSIKTKSQEKANNKLWLVNDFLSDWELQIDSKNNSYEFLDIQVTDKPYINGKDEQGDYIYSLGIKASVYIPKNK